ncbi:MAG: sodium:solute symporter family protein [Caldiserica bacterium]|jgi:SSS family solute:Na+ symporter|nr:sodium:solute symporter family protein [Caldisericota bacterium]MDH7562600.1 sodium:solute symporter family protein [Caldisericota bacterium]
MGNDFFVPLGWVDWAVILIFFSILVGMGVYFSRRRMGFDDFFSAGRKITSPLLVATLVSTFYGLGALFGTGEVGYMSGIVAIFSFSIPFYFMFIIMAFLAPRIRDRNPEARTMVDIMGEAYGKGTRVISALTSFLYSTNTMEIMGMGFIFSLFFHIPFTWGVVLGTVLSLIYTFFGGLKADILSDLLQFSLMLLTLGVATLLSWSSMGGINGILEGLSQLTGGDPSTYFHPLGGFLTLPLFLVYGVSALAVLGDPAFFQRIFASASGREIRRGFLLGIPMWLSFDLCVTLLGITAAAANGLGVIGSTHPDQGILAIVGKFLPPGLMGLFVAGLFATAMSTADSYFLVGGGNLVYDIFRPILKPQIEDRRLTRYTRVGVLISAGISLALVFYFGRIVGVWVFQASLIINSVLVPLYGALFGKGKKERLGGVLSSGFGFLSTILFYLAISLFGYFNPEWETFMIDVPIFGRTFTIWQEYNVFFILPLSAILYFLGNWLSREKRKWKSGT